MRFITLQKEVFALQKGSADKILIEKKERRLTVISKGKVLKTYKIALGETRMVQKKGKAITKPRREPTLSIQETGTAVITCLFIFPIQTRKTKSGQKELGVSPGGDIMIHGIKNGFSWVGDFHTEVDWTKGCIAVTDEEIEEIEKLAPNGTMLR